MDPNDKPDLRLGTTSLLDYARDLEEYIHNLDQKPFLMGHSMGGLLAQILGARGLAKGLVLLTPASPSGINALKYSVIKSFWLLDFKGGSKVDQSNVSCPVLVVAGTEDRITPASVVRKVADKYKAV
jgi:pimeloyl-ACP methyl ester carboxylesterase